MRGPGRRPRRMGHAPLRPGQLSEMTRALSNSVKTHPLPPCTRLLHEATLSRSTNRGAAEGGVRRQLEGLFAVAAADDIVQGMLNPGNPATPWRTRSTGNYLFP